MKMAKGTHKSMGTKGGASAGLTDGLSEVTKFKASNAAAISEDASNKGTQRPKAESLGTISKS